MPRRSLLTATTILALIGAGCSGDLASPANPPPAERDILFLRTAGGVTFLPTAPGGAAVTVPRAVPSTDWSTVVGAVTSGDLTRVVATDASSGRQLWAREALGRLEVKAVSSRGALAVLASPGGGYAGRRSTTLVVVGQNLSEPLTARLAGNFEPEAFSADGRSLFVIQYLPARRPTSYRVRRLDLGTGVVEGVYSVDAHLQEAMRGTARIQASSPDGRRLYTLYTLRDGAGTEHAFIHVLSLDELWAHCIDLPPAFAAAPERDLALAVAPKGRLYVANARSDAVAEIDTEALTVLRSVSASFDSPGGAAHVAVGSGGLVFVGKGTRLVALDVTLAQPRPSWDLEVEARILGLQAGADGSRVYVGSKDGVVAIDPLLGRTVDVINSDELGVIAQLGPSIRHLDEGRRTLQCAC